MNTHYKLRITPGKSSQADSFAAVRDYIDITAHMWAYVREGGTPEQELHYHFYVVTKQNDSQFRYNLRKLLGTGGVKGNSVFSLSTLVFDQSDFALEYLAYLNKTKTIIFTSDNFPKKILDEAAELSKNYEKKRKEPKAKSMIDRLKLVFEINFYLSEQDYWLHKETHEVAHPDSVLHLVISYFKANEIMIRESSIISYTQTLLMRYDKNYADNLQSRLLQKI